MKENNSPDLLYNVIKELKDRLHTKTKARKDFSIEYIFCKSKIDFHEDKKILSAIERAFKPYGLTCTFQSFYQRNVDGEKDFCFCFKIFNLNGNKTDELPF